MTQELVAQARELREQLLEQEERLRLALQAANLGTSEHVPGTHALPAACAKRGVAICMIAVTGYASLKTERAPPQQALRTTSSSQSTSRIWSLR